MQTETLAPDDAGIARAARLIGQGACVAFPTETVYGLGADARNDDAVAGIFAAKNRPRFNPLIVHVADLDAAEALAVIDAQARRVAEAFWPGPLTLVLPCRPGGGVSRLVTAGLETVAIRVPAAPVAAALLRAAGPVAAPSANPSGRLSPTRAAHVLAGLGGRIAAIVDGGSCDVGVESTILDMTGAPRVLRHGGVTVDDLAAVLRRAPDDQQAPVSDAPIAPGQLAAHYAPRAPLRMNAAGARPGEWFLAFGPADGAAATLSETSDLREATARLFATLHALDAAGAPAIAVAPIPDEGLGRAINDRLRRAAVGSAQATSGS